MKMNEPVVKLVFDPGAVDEDTFLLGMETLVGNQPLTISLTLSEDNLGQLMDQIEQAIAVHDAWFAKYQPLALTDIQAHREYERGRRKKAMEAFLKSLTDDLEHHKALAILEQMGKPNIHARE